LSPDKIGYVAGVYRPENRFPAKYFSEIVRVLDNPGAASLDYFSYFSQIPDPPGEWLWAKTPPVWEVDKATTDDLFDFEGYYNNVSGGCLAKALDLTPQDFERKALQEEYSKLGLKRIRHLYAIRKNGVLRALLELHQADTGLSLSRVDRAVLAFVLDNELPPNLLFTIIRGLTGKLELDAPPLMVYPRDYATAHGLEVDKRYDMMILNVAHGEEYMKFLDAYSAQHHKKGEE